LDNVPVSAFTLGKFFGVDGKQLQQQYKDHISDYRNWNQREHASEWILYPDNCGERLSIDETSLSNGELYTILTSKAAKGGKGALVAMIKGTGADSIEEVLERIPEHRRKKVKEVTLDMAASMKRAVKRVFSKAMLVIDRFHVQKLAFDAVQELRIHYRWEALDKESRDMEVAKAKKQNYRQELLYNGDSEKQLLARSRYLLFRRQERWSESQQIRAAILFERYPVLKLAYELALKLGDIFNKCKEPKVAYKRLALWYTEVEDSGLKSFAKVARSVQAHYAEILNFFEHRSTNAAAESFNAKIKAFRTVFRGVRDTSFFLYRLSNIYA
jgi:transposase